MAILGIDEVGRGPWAGPLVIGAVILKDPTASWCKDLNDSKKLTPKKRESLNDIILREAASAQLGWVSSGELDKIGLSAALKLATKRAVKQIQTQRVPFSEIIIDGTVNFLEGTKLENYVTTLKKADSLIKEVSAASIIAKVARDRYMANLAKVYPEYGFEKHVGYGTALHREALQNYGPCPEHRLSFRPLANLTSKNSKKSLQSPTTKALGGIAEEEVADFLEASGHEIIARNYKTKLYEIDIISTKEQTIYFTEVKYRKSQARGTSLEQITSQKLKQMTFAAESFLHSNPFLAKKYSPMLAAAAVSGANFSVDAWFVLS